MFLGGVRSVCFSITKNLCNGENEIYFSKSMSPQYSFFRDDAKTNKKVRLATANTSRVSIRVTKFFGQVKWRG